MGYYVKIYFYYVKIYFTNNSIFVNMSAGKLSITIKPYYDVGFIDIFINEYQLKLVTEKLSYEFW